MAIPTGAQRIEDAPAQPARSYFGAAEGRPSTAQGRLRPLEIVRLKMTASPLGAIALHLKRRDVFFNKHVFQPKLDQVPANHFCISDGVMFFTGPPRGGFRFEIGTVSWGGNHPRLYSDRRSAAQNDCLTSNCVADRPIFDVFKNTSRRQFKIEKSLGSDFSGSADDG